MEVARLGETQVRARVAANDKNKYNQNIFFFLDYIQVFYYMIDTSAPSLSHREVHMKDGSFFEATLWFCVP